MRKKGPKHQKIQAHLSELLDSGQLQPGDQIPSERTLMRQFDASNMPVRQAIQHFIDKGLFQRIHGRGTFVCAEATEERCNRIAVVYVYDHAGMWASPFYTEILCGIEDVTLAADKQLMLQSVAGKDIYAALCKLEDDVDGFLVLDLFPSLVPRVEKYIREKRKPVGVVNYPHDWTGADVVVTDDAANTRILVQHLIEQGHKRVALLYQYSMMGKLEELHPSFELRRKAYRETLEKNGIAYDEALDLDVTRADFEETLASLLSRNPSCVMCCSSQLATKHILPTLQRMELSVPKDVSVVAYDNTRDTAECTPPLTVIDTDVSALGQIAARRLLEYIESPTTAFSCTLLKGSPLERESVSSK